MATLTVSPAVVAPGIKFAVTYADGNRIRFTGPVTKTSTRTSTSGTFKYSLPTAGVYRVDLLQKRLVAVASTTITVRPVVIEPVPDPVVMPSWPWGRAGAGRIEDWLKPGYRIIHENKTFTSTLKLDGGIWTAPGQKVIVGSRFQGNSHGITIANADDVLIWNNAFEGLRTHDPGRGCHGINASGHGHGIMVVGNLFGEVSADGIQIGGSSSNDTQDWRIAYNDGIGPGRVEWGENFLDIKGTRGGIEVDHNLCSGWYMCKSPKYGGTQDCSGSPGAGIVLHAGSSSFTGPSTGRARKVSLHDNLVRDIPGNGIVVSECEDIDIGPNEYDRVGVSLTIHNGQGPDAGADRVRVSRAQKLTASGQPDIRVPVEWYA